MWGELAEQKEKIPNFSSEIDKTLKFSRKVRYFLFLFGKFTPHRGGVPKVFNFEKKTRQSTDLEEYDFVVPKNFI